MRKNVLAILAGLAIVAGCTTTSKIPTTAELDAQYNSVFLPYTDLNTLWQVVDKELDRYYLDPSEANRSRYLYLYERYIAEVARRESEIKKVGNITRYLQVTWGNIGRAGAGELQPGYVHVLGGVPTYNNVRSYSPRRNASRGKPVESIADRAWRRYCNYGKGMTADDWKYIASVSGSTVEVPLAYRVNCHPPK